MPNHTLRRGLLAGLGSALALTLAGQAHAQTAFPAKPIRLIVPHAAGGNSDAFGRIVGQRLSERLGQQVIVENRPGAGGTIASAAVARSAPDGYTLLVADNGTHAIAPTLWGNRLQYHAVKDFSPITLATIFPAVLLVHTSVPARTPQEFVALAKAQPGKLTFSSAGTGNGSHLTLEMFRYAAGGLDMVHVPYKGGAPAIQALAAGEVQLTAVSVNTALPHLKSGRVRALAMASSKRSAALPDVPTLAESGIQGAESDGWLAILGPAGIPADVVGRLNREFVATMAMPDVKERLAQLGLEVVGSTVAYYQQLQEKDLVKWGDAVRRSGAVAE